MDNKPRFRRHIGFVAAFSAVWSLASGADAIRIDLSKEKPGGEPVAFLAVVGDWVIAQDEGRNVVMADGRVWKRGQPAGGLADKARAIYGSKHEEFIESVKAFAYFPYAVATGIDDFRNGDISVRFKMVDGKLDRCSGILFNLKPNGDYLAVRFNGTEDNLVLWTFKQGTRSFVKKGVKDVPLQMNQWYDMKISVSGMQLEGYLNGERLLEYTLPEPVTGKVGLWSKTDSVSAFSDFIVSPAS